MGAPQAKIVVRAGELEGREFMLTANGLQIGRSPSNDVSVKDPKISKEHVRIYLRGDQFVVRDLGSSNGTAVNGAMITEKALEHEDVIAAGNLSMQYVLLNAPAGGGLVPMAAQVPSPVAPSVPQSPPPAEPAPGYNYQAAPSLDAPSGTPEAAPASPGVAIPRAPIVGKLVGVLLAIVLFVVLIFVGQKITNYYAGQPEIPHISFHLRPFIYNIKGEPQEFENFIYLRKMSYEFATGRSEEVEFAALCSPDTTAMTLDKFKNFPDVNQDAVNVISSIKLMDIRGKAAETEKSFSRVLVIKVNLKMFAEGKSGSRKVAISYLNAYRERCELWLNIWPNPPEPQKLTGLSPAERDTRGAHLIKQGKDLSDKGRYYMALKSFEEADYVLDNRLCSSSLRKTALDGIEKERAQLDESQKAIEKEFFVALDAARKTNTPEKWHECYALMRDINLLVPKSEEPWRQRLGIFFTEINERLDAVSKKSKEQQGGGLF